MLDSQINMYSVDTGHFYSKKEKHFHEKNCAFRSERSYLDNRLLDLEKKLMNCGLNKETIKELKTCEKKDYDQLANQENLSDEGVLKKEFCKTSLLIRYKRRMANATKIKLLNFLKKKMDAKEALEEKWMQKNDDSFHKKHFPIRKLRENELKDTNIISVFESSLTRIIGIPKDTLTDALIVVQIYYFDVFKDISFYGFTYKGEKYKYFTSSAGQIRKKKAVFIKESIWDKVEKTVMCGLTIEKINSKGGNNVNKHLAYMALSNSATDEWKEFDIDRCIVIDDFETNVPGKFDFIDEKDYSIIEGKEDIVPITHTDGAGMMLPSVMDKNTMFRAPWIKGLLGVFDFKNFIIENNYSPIITDIYGQNHNVILEDIRIIFTKSQFKMYKFYDSWDEYKCYFKKYHCQAGRCNTEEDRIKDAKINYQMLQTLTDITDDEIDKITNICTSKETMMDILGITPYNKHLTPFQMAIKLYPSLLNDTYAKDSIREVKDSLLKKYRSGKLEINGKYTFLLPDYYAACEYWFGHIDVPEGLLQDQEVFCWLFKRYDKLDCLRSPHLYKEHAIRKNVAHDSYGERVEKIRKWFTTNAIYTSTYDLISKILQFDVDGDKSLVVADPDFVAIAEKNMQDILPLYYNMQKAKPEILNNKSIYNGLNKAFVGGNIGFYSNNISKIWNSSIFVNGTDKEKKHAIDCVKRLCCQNNFVIDYAKTLYKPDFPKDISDEIREFTKQKLPAFFEYAKDKKQSDDPKKSQVAPRNQSFVNKIYDKIPNKPINTRGLKLEKLEYQKLMQRPDRICAKEISELYDKLNTQYRYMVNMKDENDDNLRYVACNIRDQFLKLGYSENVIADMLVQYLYGNKKRGKQLFWFCFGHCVVNNIMNNKSISKNETKIIECVDCGRWFEVKIKSKSTRCNDCQHEYRKKSDRERKNKLKQ